MSRVRLCDVICKRKKGEHTNSTGLHFLIPTLVFLFNEESFPKLISAYERFHRAESAEKVLYFAVLVNLLRGAQYCR
jgi:hypothetical protein